MKKDMIFFGENGITSTLANTICNWTKEYVTNLEALLNSINFVHEEVALIGSNNTNELNEGTPREILQGIPEDLATIAKAKSLIAWLREAIKARNNLMTELNNTPMEIWAETQNIELPVRPTKDASLDEDTYISNLNVKERNRYYELETLCAVIGKYIHPDGTLSNARKHLNDKILHPHKVNGSGRDALIYSYTPSVKAVEVEDVFFELQKQHREAQAELNGIKYKMETAINTDATDKQAKYVEEMTKYRASINIISEQFTLWKKETQAAIQKLKIIIPNSLTDIYNKVKELGNNKQ